MVHGIKLYFTTNIATTISSILLSTTRFPRSGRNWLTSCPEYMKYGARRLKPPEKAKTFRKRDNIDKQRE